MADINENAAPATDPEPAASAATEMPAEGEAPAAPEIELEDLELDGIKHAIPKAWRSNMMMHADYTRKTQELAESRRALEEQFKAHQADVSSSREHILAIGELANLNRELEQFQKITPAEWQQLETEDFFSAYSKFRDYEVKRAARDRLLAQVQQEEGRRRQSAEADYAARREQAKAGKYGIDGWNDELAASLEKYSATSGVTEAEIKHFAIRPELVRLLHKAYQFDQIAQKQQKQQQPKSEDMQSLAPLTQVSKARTSVPSDSNPRDSDSAEAWNRKRWAQVTEQRRRMSGRR